MRVFHGNNRVNFVDENNVVVGYDLTQCCCESANYYFCRDINNIVELEEKDLDLKGFTFDTDYHEHGVDNRDYKSGDSVTFKLSNNTEVIYLTIYNSHNGYYRHGFHFTNKGTDIECGGL